MGAERSASRWTHRPRTGALALGVVLASLVAPALAGAADGNALVGIDVEPRGNGRVVRIRTESTPTFTVFRLSDPMRVVVDVSGGDISRVNASISVDDGVLGQIAVRQFSSDGFHIARVMVGFDHELPYEVFAEGNAVVVSTGEGAAGAVGHVSPPPVAPVDRAAAERLETARAEADEAAKRAERERKAADEAAANARHQQDEAQRVAAEADRRAAEATTANAFRLFDLPAPAVRDVTPSC
jgi:type IV pilus assembly protein PilQ